MLHSAMANPTALIGLCILFWGVWGIFTKLSNVHNSPAFVTFAAHLLYALFSLPLLWRVREEGWDSINWKFPGIFCIVMTGVLGVVAKFLYHLTISKAPASQVVPAAAAYPAVTVLIAVIFLKERLHLIQGVGLLLCIAGVYLLTMKPSP